jgi:hypothetical protein
LGNEVFSKFLTEPRFVTEFQVEFDHTIARNNDLDVLLEAGISKSKTFRLVITAPRLIYRQIKNHVDYFEVLKQTPEVSQKIVSMCKESDSRPSLVVGTIAFDPAHGPIKIQAQTNQVCEQEAGTGVPSAQSVSLALGTITGLTIPAELLQGIIPDIEVNMGKKYSDGLKMRYEIPSGLNGQDGNGSVSEQIFAILSKPLKYTSSFFGKDEAVTLMPPRGSSRSQTLVGGMFSSFVWRRDGLTDGNDVVKSHKNGYGFIVPSYVVSISEPADETQEGDQFKDIHHQEPIHLDINPSESFNSTPAYWVEQPWTEGATMTSEPLYEEQPFERTWLKPVREPRNSTINCNPSCSEPLLTDETTYHPQRRKVLSWESVTEPVHLYPGASNRDSLTSHDVEVVPIKSSTSMSVTCSNNEASEYIYSSWDSLAPDLWANKIQSEWSTASGKSHGKKMLPAVTRLPWRVNSESIMTGSDC